MSSDDLKTHATSQHDFYELLGVAYETSEADIKRAYRKTSLKYHPDKNSNRPDLVEKFHLIGIARDVLLDPEAKALHDKARLARRQKQLAHDKLEGRRKAMKEDLERRESGFKRKVGEELEEEEKRAMKIRRLQEDGRRRVMELVEKTRKQQEEEEQDVSVLADTQQPSSTTPSQAQAPEEQRRIFVRFLKEGDGDQYNEKSLTSLFSRFGKVESVYVLGEKRVRLAGEKHKKSVTRAAIVYGSAFSAMSALEDGKKLSEAIIDITTGYGPSKIETTAGATHPPSTPVASPGFSNSFRASIGSTNGGVGASPSFSFSPMTAASPSNREEATLMRLRAAQRAAEQAAERRRLEEEIRKEEEAEEGQ